jgi:hypothetical protein
VADEIVACTVHATATARSIRSVRWCARGRISAVSAVVVPRDTDASHDADYFIEIADDDESDVIVEGVEASVDVAQPHSCTVCVCAFVYACA